MDGQRRFAVIGTDARLAAAGRALARAGGRIWILQFAIMFG